MHHPLHFLKPTRHPVTFQPDLTERRRISIICISLRNQRLTNSAVSVLFLAPVLANRDKTKMERQIFVRLGVCKSRMYVGRQRHISNHLSEISWILWQLCSVLSKWGEWISSVLDLSGKNKTSEWRVKRLSYRPPQTTDAKWRTHVGEEHGTA